jgi:hypothetical protein
MIELLGWEDGSAMPGHYGKRRTREKAAAASLAVQEKMPAIGGLSKVMNGGKQK